MKFKISRSSMLDMLQIVQGITGGRNALPILSNVLLKAEDGKLWLTTSNLEVSVRCGVEAEISKPGATTIPARRVASIIKELPSDEIEIDVDEKHQTKITCGRSYFKVVGLSDEEFPPLPDFESGFSYVMEQAKLKEMIRNISYSASTDETRYVLNGVLMSFQSDKLTMVATDGRRLALMDHELEFPKEAEADFVVPTKAVGELMHSLKDEGQVKIRSSGNQVAFEFDDILVISKLIEGSYPNYRQVIPTESEQRVEIERESLLNTVKRVSLLTSEKSNSVRMKFANNSVEVSVETPEVGEARESLAIKYDAEEISVAFNPEYLMDPLRHLTADVIYLEMTDELSPGVLKCSFPFLYVLMPMRVS